MLLVYSFLNGHPGEAIGSRNWRRDRLGYSRFVLPCFDAIDQTDRPAAGVAVDPHGDLGFAGRMIGRIVQHDEVGTELADRQDVTVDVQLHAHDGGMNVAV